MILTDDPLDREERLRIEALTLAIEFAKGPGVGAGEYDSIKSLAGNLHELAAEFVKFIEEGLPDPDPEDDEET